MFSLGSGRYELYDATKHGTYQNGLPAEEQAVEAAEEPSAEASGDGTGTSFAYEEHLRDFLAKNIQLLEPSLTLWHDSEDESVEFPVEKRRIDILAMDKSGVPVVVELKVSRGHERTIGQCLYYQGKIKELMKLNRVRIFIVAEEISPELRVAARELPDVTLFEYSLSMSVRRL